MLKDYICSVPFGQYEVYDRNRYLCCAAWLDKPLTQSGSIDDVASAWSSDAANDIRDSILDGSYRYCNSKKCPFLQAITHDGQAAVGSPVYHKDSVPKFVSSIVDKYKKGEEIHPVTIHFSFDESCNLECPSCRVKVIMSSGKQVKKSKAYVKEIRKAFGKTVKTLTITGTGDPFVSVAFRDFLRDFDPKHWPSLTAIHLHTNATRWTPDMWNSMKKVHKYIRSCEVSIDAASKDTYENGTRIRGNWDELMSNLKFIGTLPYLKNIKTSFVVQQKNYHEMKKFYDLVFSILPKNKTHIFFSRITNWGTFTDEEFLKQDVLDASHPEHQLVLNENQFLL